MVVAAIAYQRLSPAVRAEVDHLAKIGGSDRADEFLSAACWPDDIRPQHRETGPWHYIDFHFRTDGKQDENKPDAENVVWAIDKFSKVLGNRSAPDAERADAMRYLEHFVGDVHQPLHATSKDSDELPQGDAGGNKFPIQAPPEFAEDSRPPKNLHALWDFGAGLLESKRDHRPLSRSGRATIVQLAHDIAAQYRPAKHPSGNPTDWAMESLKLDEQFVYSLPQNTVPSPAYMEKARAICAQRLSLAGFRLADLLNRLLK